MIDFASSTVYYFKIRSFYDTCDYKFYSLTPTFNIRTMDVLMSSAETVWREDSNNEVRFVKDRSGRGLRKIETEEEYKEFMWVKLCSFEIGITDTI